MLTDKLKDEIEKVDILTDFDEVMIKEQSAYTQICAYFLYLRGHDRVSFIKKLTREYQNYKKNRDVFAFYTMLTDCPAEVIDKTVCKYKQNKKWDKLIDKLRPKKIGVVSRNNDRIIARYLNLKKLEEPFIETNIVAANKPEIENGIYTGNVELIVNNDNLIDFVKEKDYICGDEEKKVLEDFRVHAVKIERGLYICTIEKSSDRYFFIENPKNKHKIF